MSGAYNKMLKFNQEQISSKISFVIHADTVSIQEKGKQVITFISFEENRSHQK